MSADKPARSSLLAHSSHNGQYGCIYCLISSTNKVCADGKKHIFYKYHDFHRLLREDVAIAAAALRAVQTSEPMYGTLGQSFLLNFITFKPVSGTAIDYMHTLDLGVTRKILELLFSSKFSKYDFSCVHLLEQVNTRIKSLKFPQGLVSRIRCIGEPGWRAHEYRAFALYYGLFVLKDLCHSGIYKCFQLLNSIYFISLSQKIFQSDIDNLSKLTIDFLDNIKINFGEYWVTINFHEVVHIPQVISRIGPLFYFSTYGYENMNRLIRNLIHGTKNVDKEIFKRFESVFLSFRNNSGSRPDQPFTQVIQAMLNPTNAKKISFNLGNNLGIVGSFQITEEPEFLCHFDNIGHEIYKFDCLMMSSDYICSSNYCESFKFCNNTIAKLDTNQCFEVRKFLFYSDMNQHFTFAYGDFFEIERVGLNLYKKLPRARKQVTRLNGWQLVFHLDSLFFSACPNNLESY